MARFTGPLKGSTKMAGPRKWFGDLPVDKDPDYVTYFNDFLESRDYTAGDWTVTSVDTNSDSGATRGLAADELNGALAIVTNDNALDSESLQQDEEIWKLESGKKLWMEANVKVDDADQTSAFIGLGVTDTTPLDTSDRVGFQIDDESGSILCKSEKDSTETSTDSGVDLVDDTYAKVGFAWNGSNTVEFYVNRQLVATHTANIPDNENLAITLHIKNGDAAASTLSVDYILVCKER